MRVGVLMLPADPWTETVARAQRLEALGYDHIWTYDHLTWRRYREHNWYAAIPWLTGIACATSRVRIGTMVASPNFRHPVPLAKEAVSLHNISDGRFVLGIGAGGTGFDATVFGYDVLAPAALVARLGEFLELFDRLLREPEVSFAGEYFTAHEALVRPQPRVPVAVAAGGPKALALAARYGDAWITYGDAHDPTPAGTVAAVRRQSEQLDGHCAAIGRDPSTVDRIYLAGNTEERPLASAEAFRDFAGRYEALGITDIVFHHPRPDDPVWNEPESIVEEIAAARSSM